VKFLLAAMLLVANIALAPKAKGRSATHVAVQEEAAPHAVAVHADLAR
jgi:hypothetical protein